MRVEILNQCIEIGEFVRKKTVISQRIILLYFFSLIESAMTKQTLK
jgi:hypothetical protein